MQKPSFPMMFRGRSGAGLGEYALIAALIAGVSAIAVSTLGLENRDVFSRVASITDFAGDSGGSGGGGDAGGSNPGEGGAGGSDPGGGEDGGGDAGAPAHSPGPNFAITLGSQALPQANRLSPWTFDFSSLAALQDPGAVTPADLSWSGGNPDLPAWLSLNPQTGVASGVPNAHGTVSFEVVASYSGVDGRQVFLLDVGGALVSVLQISSGWLHTCAVTTAGAALCWGRNDDGQLGDGTTTQRRTPVAVSGLSSGVASISAGLHHTCAVTTAGAARCWGQNTNGQIGDGTTTRRLTPTTVTALSSGVASISTGHAHSCAVTTAGAVRCWGYNAWGQLGDNSTTQRLTPTLALSSGATVVAAGDYHTCAVTNGAAVCWGYNGNGQVGDGTTTYRLTPRAISGYTAGVRSITAGGEYSCLVTTAGAARCWGRNDRGQLGDGTTTRRLSPVAVSGLASGVSMIAAGGFHTCAVTTGGAARCWGNNSSGQLGDDTWTQSTTSVPVSGLGSGVATISAGGSDTCATTTSGVAKCWGSNSHGQLGDGSINTRRLAVDVIF